MKHSDAIKLFLEKQRDCFFLSVALAPEGSLKAASN